MLRFSGIQTAFVLAVCFVLFSVSCGDNSSTGPEADSFNVSGVIVDSSGNPLSGVTVTLSGNTVTSGANGAYTFTGLENGPYTVSFEKSGFTFEPESIHCTVTSANVTLQQVTGASLPDTYSLSGYVLDADETGVPGVTIKLSGNSVYETAATDSTGAYSFSGLSSGTYILIALKEGWSCDPSTTQAVIDGSDVTIPPISATALTFSVRGRVIDNKGTVLAGVSVTATGTGGEYTGATNKYGTYAVEGLPDGDFTVVFEKAGYTFTPPSLDVTIDGNNVYPIDIIAIPDEGISDQIEFVSIPEVTEPYLVLLDLYVTISPFEMGRTEVTNHQYAHYLTEVLTSGDIIVTATSVQGTTGEWSGEEYLNIDDGDCQISFDGESFVIDIGTEYKPAVEVTWYGAKAFAAHYGYDLPTEAEWQYAASGGMGYQYGTDDGTLDTSKANYDRNVKHATVVGSYPANPFGLYDMAGNVWEWCHDWVGAYPEGTYHDYTGAASGENRSIRGGSWDFQESGCAVTYRSGSYPDMGRNYIGFRVVRR